MESDPPYLSVRPNFSNSDYRNVCDRFGGGFERWPAWRDLGDLLAHRPGWHFDVVNHGEALWCLGVLGESRLTVFVDEELRYYCHDHDRGQDVVAVDTSGVAAWLEGREEAARKPSQVLVQMASDDDWKILKVHPFRLYVSWSDGYFAASLSALPEASFGATLAETVNRAAEMICHLFGAPTRLAPELTLTVDLDAAAARHLRTSLQGPA